MVAAAMNDGGGKADMSGVMLQSTLSCPHCGFASEESMPLDACVFFYDCPNCHALLRPKAGDCCVFCSYSSVKCPPIQMQGTNATCCGDRGHPSA